MFADQSGQPTSSAGRSPGLTLNLSSNNPFRRGAPSPNGPSSFSPPPPRSPFDDPTPPPRPVSRNPFLDPNSNNTITTSFPIDRVKSPDSMASKDGKSPSAEELFDNLTLEEKGAQKAPLRPMNKPPPGGPPRGENQAPRGRGPPPRGGPPHRPSRSQEEAMRARKMHGPHASTGGDKSMLDTKRAERRPERRPRRNSDTSIMDSPLTEEERKLIETRRRERERRHREKREEGKDVKDPTKKPKRLDLIDQLDATSIYGTGLFHHDGPFDALNPHRNRGGRRAPMQAFPEGSLNNSLGGSGPLNARPDHATFMGHHDDEAHKDYNFVGKDRNGYDVNGQRRGEPIIFDPSSRGSVLHGDESIGLGTSTFLEGTPAARAAIQRREQEQQEAMEGGGLQRKKSLAQRIRGINRPPRDYNGRFTNPEATYGPRTGDSAGERNPFFDEFDKDSERITVKSKNAGPISPGSADGGRSPGPYGLERRATSDSFNEAPAKPQGGGFLGRMKSLKGGKRQRPEVPPHASPAPPAPGQAV
ncbi:uncharacterized protein PG986_010914 [Apiospora aurea]|uniref:Pal1 cell morphology protein n=1 Tax=Apiospora aurea TaxID=335848 RepID=A0ABR1Q3N0_9PEZI